MRRVALLFGVTAFVAWLVAPRASLQAATDLLRTGSGVQGGFTDPYYTCDVSLRQCVERPGCGASECENDQQCGACEAGAEQACLAMEWDWNEQECECSEPECHVEGGEEQCATEWGTWDPSTCTCSNQCSPGPPMVVDYQSSGPFFMWCTDCNYGQFEYDETIYYAQYCEDGRLWDQYADSSVYYYQDWSGECWYLCWNW